MSDIQLVPDESGGGYRGSAVALVFVDEGEKRLFPAAISTAIGEKLLKFEQERGNVAALLQIEIVVSAEQIESALADLPTAKKLKRLDK